MKSSQHRNTFTHKTRTMHGPKLQVDGFKCLKIAGAVEEIMVDVGKATCRLWCCITRWANAANTSSSHKLKQL